MTEFEPRGSKRRELEGLVNEVARHRISRRQFMARAAAFGLSASAIATVLAACGSEEEASPTPAAMDTTKPENLYYFTWVEYINPKVKKGFTQKTGIKIVESNFDDNEAMLAKIKAGATGYDVIVPSDYMVSIMRKTGLLVPLDMSLIPNFKYVAPTFQKPPYDPETDGNKYTIPYSWGTHGIGVRVDKVDHEITGFKDLWDPANKGDIVMSDTARNSFTAALKLDGQSLNTTDPEIITKAADKLIEQKPLVKAYDSINPWRFMARGNPITMCYNGEIVQVVTYGDFDRTLLKYVHPAEGFVMWTDNYAIPKGPKSAYAAHLFMDYILDPEVQALNMNWIGFLSPCPDAKPMIDEVVYMSAPTDEDLKRAEVMEDLGEAERYYDEEWQRVKAAS